MSGQRKNECTFVEPLLRWWRVTNLSRNYPWRTCKDPYKVIVAEILLQRTRRDKVVEVYNRFIQRYPSPSLLASAKVGDVERIIEPLGLRKRAKYLVRMAQEYIRRIEVVERGLFEHLPGVGVYVANTVKVLLGFDTPLKADSSIARVFSRYFGRPLNKRRPADTKWVNTYLNKCSPHNKKEYILALIDLAWEVCKPRNPLCEKCPLREECKYCSARKT